MVARPSTVPPANRPERARRHRVHHRSTLVGAGRRGVEDGVVRYREGKVGPAWPTPIQRPSCLAPVPASRPRLHGCPSRWPRRRRRSLAPVGVGSAVLDHRVALGEVHTVATDGPDVLNCVPAISQSPLAPGATTADKVLVAPPPRSSASLRPVATRTGRSEAGRCGAVRHVTARWCLTDGVWELLEHPVRTRRQQESRGL